MYRNFLKEVFDFYAAIILFILFLPIIIITYLTLFVLIGSPIYVQKRPGYKNKPFMIYKFKTLIDNKCRNIEQKKKDFKFGNFLRKSGIDEIPQLINILRGEMSLVGPRPLLMQYLSLKKFINHPRSKCIPGITGLAQIQKSTKKSKDKWKTHLDSDVFYFKNLSFFLDIKIMIMTFFKIILINEKKDYLIENPLNKKNI